MFPLPVEVWHTVSPLLEVKRLNREIYLFYSVHKQKSGRNDWNCGGKMALHHNTPVHTALNFQNFLPKKNLQWFDCNPITLTSLQHTSCVPETESEVDRMLISICRGNTRKDASAGNPNYFKIMYIMMAKMETKLESLTNTEGNCFKWDTI
jgi:hypothetical protein